MSVATVSIKKRGNGQIPVRFSPRPRVRIHRVGRTRVRAGVRYVPTMGKAQLRRVALTFSRLRSTKAKHRSHPSSGALTPPGSRKDGR